MQKTIEEDLPREASNLKSYDAFRAEVEAIVDMPDRTIDLLFRMLRQNSGRLSKRAREKEFEKLANDEIEKIEAAYGRAFLTA